MATVNALDAAVNEASEATGGEVEGDVEEVGAEPTSTENPAESQHQQAATISAVTCQLYLRLVGRINVAAEIERANQRMAQIKKAISTLEESRSKPQYFEKVPQSVQNSDAQKVGIIFNSLLCGRLNKSLIIKSIPL